MAGGDLGRGQQDVQAAAAGQRGGQVVVDQPDRNGAAGLTRGQPGAISQRPQHGDPHGFRGVGRDGGLHGIGLVGWHPDHGQQEPRVVEPGRRTVVGRPVDVDQNGIDPGPIDAQRRLGRRAQRGGQREAGFLPALQFGCHREEISRWLVLIGAAVQRGTQAGRRRHRGGVLEPDHHVADRAITDIGHHAADGDGGRARRGDHVGGHLIDANPDERRRSRLAGSRAGHAERPGKHPRKTGHDADHCGEAKKAGPAESWRGHGPGP